MDLHNLRDSYVWMCHIRASYPTAIVYFSQSENDVIVIYYKDKADRVQAVVANRIANEVHTGEKVSTALFDQYLSLRPAPDGCYQIPGVSDDIAWKLGHRTLKHQTSLLMQVHGIVSNDVIESVHLVYMDTVDKAFGSRTVECQGHLRGCVPELRRFHRANGLRKSLKRITG